MNGDVVVSKDDPAELSLKKKPRKSLVDKFGLPSWLHSRDGKCKHSFGCIENTIRGFTKTFWVTFAFKTVLGHLLLIVKPTKLIKSL